MVLRVTLWEKRIPFLLGHSSEVRPFHFSWPGRRVELAAWLYAHFVLSPWPVGTHSHSSWGTVLFVKCNPAPGQPFTLLVPGTRKEK
jgi:hypothetical protein